MNAGDLKQKQSLDLEAKIIMSRRRIREWYDHWDGDVYVAFSGGKDSTVLLNLVRSLYPEVPAVFCDTGLEFPEIRVFVKTISNVTWLRPKMHFCRVLETHGYPVVTKEQAKYIREVQNGTTEYTRNKRLHGKNGTRTGMISKKWQYLIDAPFKVSERCCDVMKKRPFHLYEKTTRRHPFIGVMASNSHFRKRNYLLHGCNAWKLKRPQSRPLSFWLDEDIWAYLRGNNVPYCNVYDMGYERTGCMFCMFGVHLDPPPNRFQRMQRTHPKQYRFCMEKLGLREVLKHLGVPYLCDPPPIPAQGATS